MQHNVYLSTELSLKEMINDYEIKVALCVSRLSMEHVLDIV